jgi:acyl-coenzyme A thioesterase PaaI-like protein
VGLTGSAVLAEARASRRGRSVVHVDAEARAERSPVARALVTYELG